MDDTTARIKIKSNNHERPLVSWHDLPAWAQSDFDYIVRDDRYTPRMFNYRGSWYDAGEFQPSSEWLMAEGWQGTQGESYFSAVVVRWFTRDGEYMDDTIVVGYAHW
jgi:hypothetical protein